MAKYEEGFYYLHNPGEKEPVLVQYYFNPDDENWGFGFNVADGCGFMREDDLSEDSRAVPVVVREKEGGVQLPLIVTAEKEQRIIHILRNPYGHETKANARMAADLIERYKDAYKNMKKFAIDSGLDITACYVKKAEKLLREGVPKLEY